MSGVSFLTYRSGVVSTSGLEYDSIHVLNQQYLKFLPGHTAGRGSLFFQTALGTAFLSYVGADLASVSWIHDSQFYEIEIRSNDAVFS